MRKTASLVSTFIATTAILYGTITAANAETLYQWKEADGSLTFSPSPPQGSGIEYRVLDTGGSAAADISLPDSPLSASQIAQSNRVESLESGSGSAAVPEQQKLQQIFYSSNSKNALPPGISRSSELDADVSKTSDQRQSGNKENTALQPELMASRQKTSQCADLGKRIVALENRMVISTTATEMDQAVLQISRYQHSYNTHCQ